jgi:3-oxoacyl-ACP reductase-like protein
MPEDIDSLLRRMIGGDELASAEILDRAATTDSPKLLVAAAVISTAVISTAVISTAVISTATKTGQQQQLLARAGKSAATTRDRQLVAVATAHLDGADDLLDVLVREHLSDFPDNILAAWIATRHQPVHPPTPARPRSSHA